MIHIGARNTSRRWAFGQVRTQFDLMGKSVTGRRTKSVPVAAELDVDHFNLSSTTKYTFSGWPSPLCWRESF